MEAPLAERIRPKHLSEYISQQHLVGPSGFPYAANCKGDNPVINFMGAARYR
jgi:putative ATPase